MAIANGSIASTNKSKQTTALARAPGKVKSLAIVILVVTEATEFLYNILFQVDK